jgi:16S rRNA (guanine(966)-N(2))-methyltransferase RsmD
MTRIISGKHKGRVIRAPKKLPVRPTTDMAKEALFNILRHNFHFSGVRALDLFAGTGNISYELGSRSCPDITSVDADHGCIRFINQTASEFDFPIHAIKSDVYKFIKRGSKQPYDIIFADPPYDFSTADFARVAELCFEHQLLSQEGILIIEHSKQTKLDQVIHHDNTRHYGGNAFSFFSLPEADDSEE